MKLTVETLNAKVPQTIVLDVELDSSVLYVKFMIQDRTKIAFDNQMLLADGQVLSNSLRLIDYDFIGDRTIHLLLIDEYLSQFLLDGNFNVTIKTLTGKTIELQVRLGARVEALKVNVLEKEGIPVYDQRLIFNGKQLEDGRQLAYYGIREGSVLHLVLRLGGSPRPRYWLQFRTLTGKTISMSGTDETVQTVIERVWKLEGIRAGNELLFNNEPLDSERRIATRTHAHYEKYHEQYYLDAYKFEQGTILTFRDKSSARAKDELPVYVKFPGSETRKALTLIVKAVHSVRNLKSAIGSKAGGRVENLKLAGDDRELEDDHKLSDYAVRHETVLHATLKLKLFVKRLDNGTIFRLEVDSRDRIENVKERIHHHEHIPTDMQVLSLKTRFETRRLEDDELADEACFKSNCNPPVLGLEVKLVRDLQIVINPYPWLLSLEAFGIRQPISLSIKSNETIRGVKSRIAKQINSSPDQHHLYFNGKQLVDNCTFDQLGVRNRVGLSFALRSNTFKISIVPIGTGRNKFEVEVVAHDTIKYLKWKLEQLFSCGIRSRFPSDRQILIYKGGQLEDDRTLLNYRIGAGSELNVSLRVVELEITVQTEFVERRVLKVRSDCAWEMFVSEIKKLGLSICSENDCSSHRYYDSKDLGELLVREPVMIKQTSYCNKCPGCARIKAFKQVTGWE